MHNYTHHVPPPCLEEVAVVYADDQVLVINKPSGLLSVAGRFVKDCALQRLHFDYPDAVIVHRLDLDTSGLMVLALTKSAVSHLSAQFRERKVAKAYEAVVFGLVDDDRGSINKAIAADWHNRPRQVIDPFSGKSALTHFQVLERSTDSGSTRLKLTPETGRSHQLRIHLASIGHPILGCDLYAHEQALGMAERLLLHASFLAFTHPQTGQRLEFNSPVPF